MGGTRTRREGELLAWVGEPGWWKRWRWCLLAFLCLCLLPPLLLAGHGGSFVPIGRAEAVVIQLFAHSFLLSVSHSLTHPSRFPSLAPTRAHPHTTVCHAHASPSSPDDRRTMSSSVSTKQRTHSPSALHVAAEGGARCSAGQWQGSGVERSGVPHDAWADSSGRCLRARGVCFVGGGQSSRRLAFLSALLISALPGPGCSADLPRPTTEPVILHPSATRSRGGSTCVR